MTIARLLVGILAAVALAAPPTAGASETPIAADLLRLRDATDPAGPRISFTATIPVPTRDPRSQGATLEIVGNGSGEGATGILALPAERWTGLGTPPGTDGYAYRSPGSPNGVRRVDILLSGGNAHLDVEGGGAAMPFAIRQPHGPIDVRFAIGDQLDCARFAAFVKNKPGRLLGRNATAPGSCAARAERCGNRVVEASEECDDGNPASGDGCSAGCQLEDASALCTGIAESPNDHLALVRVVDGLGGVTYVTAPPLDPHRLFVVQQNGTISILRDGQLLSDPFLALVPGQDLSVGSERGLLSMAFHPDYAHNGRFFVYFTAPDGKLTIARYQVSADPDRADTASRKVLLRVTHPAGNHNGGLLVFGPDGYLYTGMGDGGGGGDPDENGQNPDVVLGKLLRIDVNVEQAPFRAVPPTNPQANAGGRAGLIWAIGLRNPWRFSFDRATHDLYIADVGQNAREEIDFQPADSAGGENYGWDVFEGTACFDPQPLFPTCPNPPTGFVFPVFEYKHQLDPQDPPTDPTGCAVTGGYVYRGCRLPSLRGEYFFSDFCSSFLRTFRGVSGGVALNGRDRTAELTPQGATLGNVTTFGEDARGELYVGDQSGQVFQVVAGP